MDMEYGQRQGMKAADHRVTFQNFIYVVFCFEPAHPAHVYKLCDVVSVLHGN